MSLIQSERELYLIIVGSFNEEYNQGFTVYEFDPGEKTILNKNNITKAINPIHMQFSKNKTKLYAACAHSPENGKIAVFEIDLHKADLN